MPATAISFLGSYQTGMQGPLPKAGFVMFWGTGSRRLTTTAERAPGYLYVNILMPERSDPPDNSTCGQRVRRALRESSFGLALALASSAAAIENRPAWLPDPQLTPGAFAESSTAAICVRGYDRAHRVWHDKAGTLARYQIAPAEAALYEDDDLIPVCLGGDNASPLNHWPQPLGGEWGAEKKDMLERQLCAAVCRDRDDSELARYPAAFARDWTALWRLVFR